MAEVINKDRLRELADAYIMYEIATHGVDPRETLDGTVLRGSGEGYKYGVYEKYHEKMLTTNSHVDSLLEAMPGGNLASYHQKKVIEDRIKADGPEQLEEALTLLYKGDDDLAAFQKIVDAVGGYFDILGFVFFLKDCEQYSSIRSRKFDEKFKVLGLASDLEGNCTWEKYQEYNAWIKEIQSFLRSRINKEFTMIDAHSFVWVLPGIAEYLDSKEQIVEHKKYGKGIVTNIREDGTIVVHFGKEERMFMADAFDNGFLTIVPNDFNIYGDDNSDEGSSKNEDLKQHTSLNSLLQKSGIDLERTKLIRHAKSDPGFNKCLEKGFEFEYTRIQRKDNFKGADTWVVFISGEGTTAIFDGCYHVTGDHPNTPDVMPDGFPVPEMFNGQYSYFDLEPIHSLDQYKGKLVIEWGKAARTWDQWAKNDKKIIAIHEEPITKTDDEGTTASKGTASGSTHAVGKYDSWTIKSENIAVKHCDKSFFEYRGSGVPREIYWFFGVENLSAGAKKEIKLLYNDKEYEAYLQREIHELQRIRVFWHQDLADLFIEYYTPDNYPSLSFDKKAENEYTVSFDTAPNNSVDMELEDLIQDKPDEALNNQIDEFFLHIEEYEESEKKNEALRKKFIEDYTIDSILGLSVDQYVIGKGTNDSFCYRIEEELRELGDIHGAFAYKFGMYYGKSGSDTSGKYRIQKKFGEDPEKALELIKEQIVYLIMAGETEDYTAIRDCELWPMFRGKILSTYYPQKFLAIFIDEHLDYFISKLSLDISDDADVLDKQNRLVAWKNANPRLKDLSMFQFDKFLYSTFGRPLDEIKNAKEKQAQRDKEYPKKYAVSVKIKQSEWVELLKDTDVFYESDIDLLKKIYLEDNHATTLYDLSIKEGVHSSSYIMPVVSLARRISKAMNLDPIIGDDGSRVWWRIPFWGRTREDGLFEWKIRPDLAKALVKVYPELDLIGLNEEEDDQLISDLKQSTMSDASEDFEYAGGKKKKATPIFTNGHKTYPRDRQTAVNALAHAHFKCEVNDEHPTFIRKKSDRPYTEPHHLVPMSFSDSFDVSLDREENIVSLCSNCHNEIHYGRDAKDLIEKLYDDRKDLLESVGIVITLEELLGMYGIK